MNRLSTLRDLFRHFDWAADRVLAAAETLDDAALIRGFDIGPGSLRVTLWHNWTAHWIWFRRIAGESPRSLPVDAAAAPLRELREFIQETRASRAAALETATEAQIDRAIAYTNLKGEAFTRRLDEILLHVCNHAIHHNAQALNMLRHNGMAKPPKLDYIFMYYENRELQPPAFSIQLVRDYLAYTDWGRKLMLTLAAELEPAALDRRFEMGMGSIRKTLVHLHGVEIFWLRNWESDHESPFPDANEPVPIADLRARWAETAARRSEFLARHEDVDLQRPAEAHTPDGRTLSFPLGVTAIQLCCHATHHRAQLINMLKQLGHPSLPTDYVVWKNQATPPQ